MARTRNNAGRLTPDSASSRNSERLRLGTKNQGSKLPPSPGTSPRFDIRLGDTMYFRDNRGQVAEGTVRAIPEDGVSVSLSLLGPGKVARIKDNKIVVFALGDLPSITTYNRRYVTEQWLAGRHAPSGARLKSTFGVLRNGCAPA